MINCVKAIHPRRCANDRLLLDVTERIEERESRESNNISIFYKTTLDFSLVCLAYFMIKIYK